MLSQNNRITLILLGAVVVSLFLGSSAINNRLKPTATVTSRPAALVSLTPSDTPSAT